jgi:hypothetical protein
LQVEQAVAAPTTVINRPAEEITQATWTIDPTARIFNPFCDFGVADKRLSVPYLWCWLSGSNSVGGMPASATLFIFCHFHSFAVFPSV